MPQNNIRRPPISIPTKLTARANSKSNQKARLITGPFHLAEAMNKKKHWTTVIGQAAGHPAAFAVVLGYAILWFTFDRLAFDWNAVATLAVWGMTLFIQRSNRRDTLALHAKLDELLRVDTRARSELARLDEHEPEEIAKHRDTEVRKSSLH
jgi:low affinity Fe/Cu permease